MAHDHSEEVVEHGSDHGDHDESHETVTNSHEDGGSTGNDETTTDEQHHHVHDEHCDHDVPAAMPRWKFYLLAAVFFILAGAAVQFGFDL